MDKSMQALDMFKKNSQLRTLVQECHVDKLQEMMEWGSLKTAKP